MQKVNCAIQVLWRANLERCEWFHKQHRGHNTGDNSVLWCCEWQQRSPENGPAAEIARHLIVRLEKYVGSANVVVPDFLRVYLYKTMQSSGLNYLITSRMTSIPNFPWEMKGFHSSQSGLQPSDSWDGRVCTVEFHGSMGEPREDFSWYLIQSLPYPVLPHCSVLPLPHVIPSWMVLFRAPLPPLHHRTAHPQHRLFHITAKALESSSEMEIC